MIVLLRKNDPTTSPDLSVMADQSASPLLSLPAELRNEIWMHVLVHVPTDGSELTNHWPVTNRHIIVKHQRFCANILRACKQINAEATPILYGENTFIAHPSLLRTLPSLMIHHKPNRVSLPPVTSPRLTNMIKRLYIHVRLDVDARFSKMQAEESFSGLDELEIEVYQAMYDSCDFTNLRLFEGVRGVGKAVVQGSVGNGRYAEFLTRLMMSPPGTEVKPFEEGFQRGERGWNAWVHGNR
jgi:hypothetical protein